MGKEIKLPKELFLVSMLGGAVFAAILLIAGVAMIEEPFLGVLFIVLGFLVVIYVLVINCVIVYRMWKSIQDYCSHGLNYCRTTPGKAVVFMLFPLFNIYWIFQVYWGFSKDYNAFIKRHLVTTSQLPEGLFLSYSILAMVSAVVSAVPYLGMLAGIASLIILIIMIVKICDAVNALQTAAAPAKSLNH